MGCVLPLVAAKGMQTQNAGWKCLQTQQTGPCLPIPCVLSPLPGPVPQNQQNLHVQLHQLAPLLLGRNNQKPKNDPNFTAGRENHKPGISGDQLWVGAQTAATSLSCSHQLFLVCVPSWAQLTHPPNVSVCWPNLPIPCSFLTAKERISSSHFAQLSSARGRWEKGWRESWKAECCPRDAALLLGAQQRHSR